MQWGRILCLCVRLLVFVGMCLGKLSDILSSVSSVSFVAEISSCFVWVRASHGLAIWFFNVSCAGLWVTLFGPRVTRLSSGSQVGVVVHFDPD